MTSMGETTLQLPPGKIKGFAGSSYVVSTEGGNLGQRANYKETTLTTELSEITKVDSKAVTDTLNSPLRQRPAEAPVKDQLERIRGVLDHVGDSTSEVTLFYGEKENRFLFPTEVLRSSGVSYAGALFEIVMRNDEGFLGYDIVHMIEEEKRARVEMKSADLSFLDEIDNTSGDASRRKKTQVKKR